MNITKVMFRPKNKAPVNCKVIEYFIQTSNWGEAIETAKTILKEENKLYRYYREAMAITINVHDNKN